MLVRPVKCRFVGMSIIYNQWASFLINYCLFVFIVIDENNVSRHIIVKCVTVDYLYHRF